MATAILASPVLQAVQAVAAEVMPAQSVVQASTAMASSESLVLQVLQAAAAAEVKPAVNVEQASMATAILALPVQPAVHAVAAAVMPVLSMVCKQVRRYRAVPHL